jgi:hypothetical protein
MNPEVATGACRDETMLEVWRLKEENAAAHGFDVDAIASAARKHQEAHSHRVVSRHGDQDLNPTDNGIASSEG